MFTQRNLSNLRDYLDKKLEDFDESEENIQKEDLSTPKPQRMIEQFKQPSFIENSQGFSQKSKLNHKYNDNDEIMDYIKKSLQNEVRNEINLNFNEVLEEKIKEFLLIKERVMPNEETMIKSKFDEKNKISLKSLEKKKNYSNKKKSKKKDENKKNKEAFEKNLNFQEKNLSNEYFPQNMKNLSNNIGYIQPNSPKEQEEITELLNYNEDFYENDLFDLIDEIDQEEFERNKTTKFNENQRAIQKTGGSLKEIIEENRNCMNSSYTETDQSIRYIKKQIKQMEESKKKEA